MMFADPVIDGELFEQFGAGHFLAVGAIAIVTAVLTVIARGQVGQRHEAVVRRWLCWGLATLLLSAWVAGQVYQAATGSWSLQESLPLHLCDVGVFVTALALVAATDARRTPSSLGRLWFELAYFWGLGGTLQAVFTPDVLDPFPAFMSVRFFVAHGGIVAAVVLMTLGLHLRPRPGSARWVWVLTLLLASAVLLIDWLLGANYMFLMGPPKRPSLFDWFGPWPWALLSLAVAGTVFIALWYSPFWIMDRLRGRAGGA